MIDLNQVNEMWSKDCIIDEMNLDESSRQTPNLHAKYLRLYSNQKLFLKKTESEQKTLLKEKWLYYNGKMTQEDIVDKGWDLDPFNGLKILKGEMDYYYDADPEIQKSEDRLALAKVVLEHLKEIIDTIRGRHQTIGNMIKWRQFQSGN